MLTHADMLVRIATGAGLGAVIGYERDLHGRPVGLRTHLLVALASATFMVVSSQFAYYQHFDEGDGIGVDASRIAASVVSAVGFLAAGSIMRTGDNVQGLTTAAGLWLVTAIGLCAGAGMFVEGVFATVLGVFALTVLRRFEDKDDFVVRRRITLRLSDSTRVGDVTAALAEQGLLVVDMEYEKHLGDNAHTIVTFKVRHSDRLVMASLSAALEHLKGVERVHVHPRDN
jgi:putative Mg2+ transporter-C (MgtC) family protein